MQLSIHIFHKPEEAEAFMCGIDHMGDDKIATDLGPEPNEVSVRDYGAGEDELSSDEDSPDQFFDHRLQISNPTVTATHPDQEPTA